MAGPPSPRLFLVDGYALIYRAFFALGSQPLINSRGENTSIAHGANDFLKRLISRHKPEYLGWVHDAGYSFRHDKFPAYKATREKLDPERKADFDTGVERITQMLRGYRVPVLSLDGFEADDVIGTLARQATEQSINTVIVSGDKDFSQLISDAVTVLNPWHGRPGFTSEKWYDVNNGRERLGVPPERVVDYLALLGDSSDNIPGVKGIGEKTAHALIERFGTLEQILEHTNEVEPARARNALLQFRDNGLLSKELVTIRRDLDVQLDLALLARREPDWAALRDFYVELEFRAQAQDAATHLQAGEAVAAALPADATRPQAKDGPPGASSPHESAIRTTRVVTSPAEVAEVVSWLRASPWLALHVGTTPESGANESTTPLRARIVSLALATAEGEAVYFPFGHRSGAVAQEDLGPAFAATEKSGGGRAGVARESDQPTNLPPIGSLALAPLRQLLEDATVRKTLHNAKYDLLVLRRAGIVLRGIDFDTMIASYLADPGRRSQDIDALSIEVLQQSLPSLESVAGKGKARIAFDAIPLAAAAERLGAEARTAALLRPVLASRLETTKGATLLAGVELPLLHVLAEMEWTGILIDVSWFHSLKARFAKERAVVEARITEAAGEEFNIDSNKQLAAILFGKLGLPARKKTSTGPSTDASVLQELAEEGHLLPALIMEYREIAKLENTYLDTLPALVSPETGRLHTSFNQAVAATGRLASSDPNLQNIPIRRQLGKEIRKGFIPRAGWLLLAADYSQIELRVLAHLSRDPAFVEAFRAGGDIHRQTAAIIFGVPVDTVTPEMRAQAKTINFATIYGQGAHALSRQLKVEHAAAKAFIDTYFERFAGVRAFLDAAVEGARERGFVETLLGRRRYIPEIKDRNYNIRAFGERLAQNSPIQGSAADLIKVAMIRLQDTITSQGLEGRMLLQVHDELVFECPPTEVEALIVLVRTEMSAAVVLDVPLVVDIGIGKNWLEAKA